MFYFLVSAIKNNRTVALPSPCLYWRSRDFPAPPAKMDSPSSSLTPSAWGSTAANHTATRFPETTIFLPWFLSLYRQYHHIIYILINFCVKVKVKQSHYRPGGFQEIQAPRFQDNRHIKVESLTDLRTGLLYPQEIFVVLISVRGWSTPVPKCGWKDCVNEKYQWHHRESSPRPSSVYI